MNINNDNTKKGKIRMETKVIIYGAGKRGKAYYEFLEKYGKSDVIAGFCDKNYASIESLNGKKVMSFEEAINYQVPFLISIADKESVKSIRAMIEEKQGKLMDFDDMAELLGKDRVTFNREFVAYYHIDHMNQYFEDAEKTAAIDCFWGENSPFRKKFIKLDISNVIELACGRGRHVPNYMQQAGTITLVDILEQNIKACQKRFANEKNIIYYCNNGYNLAELKTGEYTSLFCYDAMVHFEMMDIYEYLKDIYRVLVPGGKVLIHHSNNASDYKASFANNPLHERSFMNKDIFAYLAYRAGFKVLEQEVIDWGKVKDLDCISLLQKPNETI